ncbi:MAG: hypothetical protein IPK01_00205 [Acidobacteria bacterium]|nr:hypothetical protein [Acidobacteriota bacterium]
MTVGSTTNRFSKIKKIRGRSIGELFSRSGQAFLHTEKRSASGVNFRAMRNSNGWSIHRSSAVRR